MKIVNLVPSAIIGIMAFLGLGTVVSGVAAADNSIVVVPNTSGNPGPKTRIFLVNDSVCSSAGGDLLIACKQAGLPDY